MSTSARLAAARALHEVFDRGSRIPESWNADLDPEEARLAQALLGLGLRRWGRLQEYVRRNLSQTGRGIPVGSRVALALGLASLAWLPGVATHAAVDQSVRLCADRDLGFPPHKGLVNAILRRAARDREALRIELDGLSWTLDAPPFAREILEAALPGASLDIQAALWERLQTPPEPAFRCLRGELPAGLRPDPALPGALLLDEGADFPRAWLESGAGMVQDRTSQALLDFRWEGAVTRILDVCAAPGGKTTALARRYPEASILALDRSPARVRRLEANLQARGIPAEVRVADAPLWAKESTESFDLILLDAPCSGSGTLRKHPELSWVGARDEVARLATEQGALLEALLPRLAPGGLLLYSVCSWFPEEGAAHLQWIRARGGFEAVPAWPDSPATAGLEAFFRPDPMTWEGEGFQAFALRRR